MVSGRGYLSHFLRGFEHQISVSEHDFPNLHGIISHRGVSEGVEKGCQRSISPPVHMESRKKFSSSSIH